MLLRNNAGRQVHWLGVRLVWKKNANPDAVGARFTYQAGDLLPSRMKVGDGSFWSVRDPRRVLGMGNRKKTGLAGGEVAASQRSCGALQESSR